jgi:hypothetical protein
MRRRSAAQLVLQDYRALARDNAQRFFHDTCRILLRSNSRARVQDAVAEQNAENAAEAQFRCKRVRVVDGVDDCDILMLLLVMICMLKMTMLIIAAITT